MLARWIVGALFAQRKQQSGYGIANAEAGLTRRRAVGREKVSVTPTILERLCEPKNRSVYNAPRSFCSPSDFVRKLSRATFSSPLVVERGQHCGMPRASGLRVGAVGAFQGQHLVMDEIQIGKRSIGRGHPAYVIAEMSANHGHKFDQAVEIIHAAKAAGADAVKLQTYTPDTITLASDREEFRVRGGTIWDGRNLHDLYGEAYTPWEWQPRLKRVAEDLGMDLFSSAFDATAVDFLEQMGVPVHKVASFELVDIPLIQRMARTGKPLIMSTGMATVGEIEEALQSAREAGATQIALLKCTSAYPAPAEEMNLRTIPEMARRFGVPVGLSDHTMGIAAPVAAVALGACIIEKHLTLSRSTPGPDSAFSLEPHEFSAMVDAVRTGEKALGEVHFGLSKREEASQAFRRSLFVVEDVKRGEAFTAANVRSIRPGQGLHPRHLTEVLGKRAAREIKRGTPLCWDFVVRS
jgi:pseudaminic acid synthase